jgi:hypothetical protein
LKRSTYYPKENFLTRAKLFQARRLTPITVATWEAEIRRIMVQSLLRQIVHEALA